MTFEEILKEEVGEDITLDDVIDDVAIDSLDYLSFIKRLEEEFRTRIPDQELGNFETFRQMEEFVEERVGHA